MSEEPLWRPVKWIFYYRIPDSPGPRIVEMILQPGTPLQTAIRYAMEKIDPKAHLLACGDPDGAYVAPGQFLEEAAPRDIVVKSWHEIERMLTQSIAQERGLASPGLETSVEKHGSPVLIKGELGDVAEVGFGMTDADFWVVAAGTAELIGMPTKEYNRDYLGIKVYRPDLVDSDFLFHLIKQVQEQETFPRVAQQEFPMYYLDVDIMAGMPMVFQINR